MMKIWQVLGALYVCLGFWGCGAGAESAALSVELDGSQVEPTVLALVTQWEVEWSRFSGQAPQKAAWTGGAIPFSVSKGDRITFVGLASDGVPVVAGEGIVPPSGVLRISLVPRPVP